MGCCTPAERAASERFGDAYHRSTLPVMLKIEREVFGGDYGGNSWTTKEQANLIAELMQLGPNSKFADLGAGSGWPAIHIAKATGSHAALFDLPDISVRIAQERAITEGLSDCVTAHVADAAELPVDDGTYDAISHSDLLCCLVRKEDVLKECRRVVRGGGCMVFTVVLVPKGLKPADLDRAIANGPEFVDAPADYPTLLDRSGWRIDQKIDLTAEFLSTCTRQLQADRMYRGELVDVMGEEETDARIENWRCKAEAIREGLLTRELFSCRPSDV